MPLGSIELVVIRFPGNRFTGRIMPELRSLVENGTISIIDGLFIRKDADGATTYMEIDEAGNDDPELGELVDLFNRFDELISDEDVVELSEALEPDESAAVLVFEHTWMAPLKDALTEAGAVLALQTRVPDEVVDEVLAEVEKLG